MCVAFKTGRAFTLGLTAVALCLAFAKPASAGLILVGSTVAATGINGLYVDGTVYNVSFISATYNSVYGSATPYFASTPTLRAQAPDASQALTAALNALNVTILTGNSAGLQSAVIADSLVSGGNFYGQQSIFTSNWAYDPDSQIGANQTYFHNDIAVFTAVPEPASLLIMGSGLACLGFLKRRKKAWHIQGR